MLIITKIRPEHEDHRRQNLKKADIGGHLKLKSICTVIWLNEYIIY